MMRFLTGLLLMVVAILPGCGYHVAGRADLVPKKVHTIAIPAFANATTRYKLTNGLPGALTREFLSRTRYRIVADPNEADAVLRGVVANYNSYPTTFDPASNRASGVQIAVTLQITLTDRSNNTVLFSRNVDVRERYEISVDQIAYFEESDAALMRLSKDVAKTVVSAILENF
jgi:outer membrane lipopolysaccharide assembly protein LptE/RlpB